MVLFGVFDRVTGNPLDGFIVFDTYGYKVTVPLLAGAAEVISNGGPEGPMRSFTVWVEGYVPHSDFFFQFNGQFFDVRLSKYYWFEPPVVTEDIPLPQPSVVPWIIGLAAAVTLLS